MIRALHLLTTQPDFSTERMSAALRRDAGAGFHIATRSIGPGGDWPNVPAALLRLRSRAAGQFDLIHAWDEKSLTAAALAENLPILFSPMRPLSRRAIGWLRAIMSYRRVDLVCSTATQRRIAVERGIAPDRCHLIRPGVEFSRVRRRRDPTLRERLGLAENDYVILAPGESTRAAGHELAVWAASILHVLDPHYRVLLWGRGPRARAAAQLGCQLAQPELVRVASKRLGTQVDFEDLLPATDAVMIAARGAVPTLPIAICMAAALPIISSVTYTVAELLEDRHTAVMTPRDSPRLLAQRLLDLRADTALQWTIADMARTEAFEYFALTRFVNQYRTAYRQLSSGDPLSLPEPAPGAGLRFHGRA